MNGEHVVNLRPRLALPELLAARFAELTLEEKAEVVKRGIDSRARTSGETTECLCEWSPDALIQIAGILELTAAGKLAWQGSWEERPQVLFKPHYLKGWADLLREVLKEGA